MNLIDIYIQEVTRRLSEKTRDDIAMELRSTIEDMLPDDYSEEDVKKALEKLGDPAVLANEYRDRPAYLIGPAFYELYMTTMKMVLPLALGIGLAIYFMVSFADWTGEGGIGKLMSLLFGESIWAAMNIFIQVFFWITLLFFILERSGVPPACMRKTGERWKPEDLKDIVYIPKKKAIPKAEAVASFVWTVIWGFIYFNSDRFIGAYEKNNVNDYEFIVPVFNQEVLLSYWPVIVLFIGTEIGLAVFKYMSGQWTNKLAIFNTIYNLFSIILSIVILTNADLVSSTFLTYMIDLLNGTPAAAERIMNWIIGGTIAIIIITAGIAIYDGFRKARIKNDTGIGYSEKTTAEKKSTRH